jgi:2'-5' RNA ligase
MRDILLRTFIAIPVPETLFPVLRHLKTLVQRNGSKVKWVRPEAIHLTLKFLGHTPESSVKEIRSILSELAQDQMTFQLSITGTGCFPKQERPRILWLGINGELDPLNQLVSKINRRLEPLGFLTEEKTFIPHLTLARISYPQKKNPEISAFLDASYDPIPFSVQKFQFISSELFSNGAVYSILSTHFFGNNSI